ncbi:unnamed protein product [Leptosia nina]|uniref:Uncharacterized protein n=1 Tax=Leptosia nina TaxID=320188 RepID=A0AAV1J0H2_9NEOP
MEKRQKQMKNYSTSQHKTDIYILLNVYFTLLVRSEFLKLKDNAKFQFFNHEGEARCTAMLEPEDIRIDGSENEIEGQ